MQTIRAWILCTSLAAGCVALAQSALNGPLTGVVYVPASRTLRPIQGFPGAAYLGTPLARDVDWASIAPDGSAAIVQVGGHLYLVPSLHATPLETTPLADAQPEAPALAAWSTDSRAAALYVPAQRQLHVLSRDNGTWSQTTAAVAEGTVHAVAVRASPDAMVVLACDLDGGGAWLLVDAASDRPSRLALPANGDALAFDPSDQHLLVASSTARSLLRFSGLPISPAFTSAALMDDQPEPWSISAIAALPDHRALLLERNHRRAIVVGEDGVVTHVTRLDAEPDTAIYLANPSLFLSGGGRAASEPIYVLWLRDHSHPQVYFIPQTPE
jgi:hypothetical protein